MDKWVESRIEELTEQRREELEEYFDDQWARDDGEDAEERLSVEYSEHIIPEAIERLIRGLNPWPSAYTSLSGKTLKIWDAEVVMEHAPETVPGTVVSVSPGELRVQTGEGQLSLREVQLEGKKRMEIEAFLRGVRLEAGTVLG